MPWLRISTDILDDPDLDEMPDDVAGEKIKACILRGEINEFSPYIRITRGRCNWIDWSEIRDAVFERDGYVCTYCGDTGGPFECDHIVPHSRGGGDTMDNLTTSCRRCNRRKKDKTPAEWLGS